jgi:hypothetical protein
MDRDGPENRGVADKIGRDEDQPSDLKRAISVL